jgi:hypothetical protein
MSMEKKPTSLPPKKTTLSLNPGLAVKLKVQAAKNGEPMVALIERAIQKELGLTPYHRTYKG